MAASFRVRVRVIGLGKGVKMEDTVRVRFR
jgi:hypothetical protein